MKLSKYIAGLQRVMNSHGDLDCYYATDDEGNGYKHVFYTGSIFFVHKYEANSYNPELCQEEEIKNQDDFSKVVVVN